MTNEESLGHFRQQQKRYMREHNGMECPHYSNAIHALEQIESLQAENAALKEANRWIPVSERLPEKPPDYFKDGHWWMVSGEDFIVADSDGKVYEAHWTYGCSHQNYFWYVNSLTPLTNITHWRPLPEPQKGE